MTGGKPVGGDEDSDLGQPAYADPFFRSSKPSLHPFITISAVGALFYAADMAAPTKMLRAAAFG